MSGPIRFTDINAGDRPAVTTHFVSLQLLDAHQNDITATLTSQQMAAVEAQLVVTPSPGNNNNGTATWTYSVADGAFNFLTAGETLTLTYDAVVNNNFLPFEQQADAQFTITINGPSLVEWIHPTGDLWSVGSNWNSGTVPTATDDVIIPAEHIPGGSGLYDVTIATPAVARTLTLNANNTTGGEVINHSTLSIGETLTIFNDGVLNNSGTVSVGGQIELLNQSLLLNYGLLTLGQGGDFKDQSSVSNSGTIELAGGTLNVEVTVANSGGTLQVDNGTTLKLNGATINGGTINDGTAIGTSSPVFGSIDVTGPSTISNAFLNNGGVTVESDVTLILDNDTVNGTTFTDTAGGATLQVDDGTTLTLSGVTIDGGTVNDGTASGTTTDGGTVFGSIDVAGNSTISSASLNNGGVTVESDVTLILDNDTVTGTTFTDTAGGATLQVDDGTTLTLSGVTINGGTVNDGTASGTTTDGGTVFGSIDVAGNSTISSASLNNGGVTVESDVTLILDNDTVTGTTFTDTAGGATLQVDDGTTLTLSGVTIDGGTVNDGTASGTTTDGGTAFGSIDVAGSSTVSNAALNNGGVTVESGVILTLDNDTVNGTTFTDTASGATIQIDDGTVLTLTGGATVNGGTINDGTASGTGEPAVFGSIDVTGPSTISNAFLNNGGVTIASGVTLTLGNDTVTGTTFTDVGTSSTAQVESGARLALNGSAISSTFVGTIDITGAVTFQSGVAVNGGAMSIAKGATLDIENPVTGIGATLNDVYVMNSGTIQVDSPGAGTTIISLVLDGGTTVTGGTLLIHVGFPINSIEGTVEIGTGGATFDNVKVENNNILKIDDGITLTLDDNAVISNGNLTIGTLGVLDVEQGPATLSAGTPDVTLDGVAVANGGNIEISTAGTGDPTLLLDDDTVISNGNLTIGTLGMLDVEQGPATLGPGVPDATLDGVAVSNSGNIDIGTAGTGDPTLLLDDGTTVSNGAMTVGSVGTLEIGAGGATLNDVSVINDNVIEILAGSILSLDLGTTVANFGATMKVDGTAALALNGATIGGGTINDYSTVSGSIVAGTIDVTGASTISGVILNNGGVTVSGVTLTLDNDTVNGTTFTDTASGSIIQIDGGTTLNLNGATIGGGTINDYSTILGSIVGATIDVTGDSTISGAVLNNGGVTIESGVTLTLDNVTVNGTTFTDTASGSIIQADGGTTLNLNGATIDGGNLSGFGTIATVGGVDTFDNVAIASVTTVNVTDNTVLDLIGTIANSGMIALNSSGDATQLEISGNVLLDGSGQVTLTDNAHNAIVSDGSAATLTNSNMITGAGTIGDTLLTLVNDGTIDATGTNSLTIDTGVNAATSAGPEGSNWSVGSLTVTNNSEGVLEASAGHTLQIDDNVLNNGLIESGNTGGTSTAVVNVAGNITGTGSIEIFENAKVEIGGSVSSGQTVTFEVSNGDAATLILDDPHDFQGRSSASWKLLPKALENYVDLKDLTYTALRRSGVSFVQFDYRDHSMSPSTTVPAQISRPSIFMVTTIRSTFEFARDGPAGRYSR